MHKSLTKLFERFAQEVIASNTAGSSSRIITHGFIQPLRYKNKMYVDTQIHKLGLDDDGRYLYIGLPCDILTGKACNGRVIEANGNTYSVIRAENILFKGKPLYVWAVIKMNRGGQYL